MSSNQRPGPDRIVFNLKANETVIYSTRALPPVTSGRVHIDASTQPGYGARTAETAPIVTVDGANHPPGEAGAGLQILAGAAGSVLRGLRLRNMQGFGVSWRRIASCWRTTVRVALIECVLGAIL